MLAVLYFILAIMYQSKVAYAIYACSSRVADDGMLAVCKFFAIYCKHPNYLSTKHAKDTSLYVLNFTFSFLSTTAWCLITSGLYMFPQIFHIVRQGKRYKFNRDHIIGFLFSRVLFVVSFWPTFILSQ